MTVTYHNWVKQNHPKFIYIFDDCKDKMDKQKDIKVHLVDLKACVEKGESEKLLEYLTYEMQLTKISASRSSSWTANRTVFTPATHCMTTCLVIEGLIRQFPSDAVDLVKAIIAKNDIKLCQVFTDSMSLASLSQDLLIWNVDVKRKMLDALTVIENHTTSLNAKVCSEYSSPGEKGRAYAKYQVISRLIPELREKINSLDNISGDDAIYNSRKYIADLRIMQFRLEIYNMISKHHSSFDQQVTDLPEYPNVLGAFSFGILNVVNYAVNGQFFFGAKTRTSVKVDKFEEVVLPGMQL